MTTNLPAVLNQRGEIVPPKVIDGVRRRAHMEGGWNGNGIGYGPQFFPYESAEWFTAEMGNWLPWIRSADAEINIFRDRMVGRQRDIVRNDGWAAGVIDRILDNTIGSSYRFLSKPDWKSLRRKSGVKQYDATWASEYRSALEAIWRDWSEDLGHYNDVSRLMTTPQQFRLALRHKMIDGESLIVAKWLPERIGYGGAEYSTSILVVDPDRLSNPMQMVDTQNMRGGVEVDDNGVPLAYHIREAHQNDWYNTVESMRWERVRRQDRDGWQRVFHGRDVLRAGQNRGVSVFAPILSRLKMLSRYYGVELQAATVASMFGTYVKSPYDEVMVQDALETDNQNFGWYQQFRDNWNAKRPAMLGDVRIPALAPGESIETVSAERPSTNFSPFTHEMLRGVASCLGVSAEQVTSDYGEVNFSSARMAGNEAEKTFDRRLSDFNAETATPILGALVHEAIDRGDLPMPRNGRAALDYVEGRTAYTRGRWLPAAKGWIDPVVERQGEILGLDAGFNTLEDVCARQGSDWEEVAHQRSRERKLFEKLGLPPPVWMGQQAPSGGARDAGKPAQQTITPATAQ